MTHPPFDKDSAERVHVALTYVYIVLLIILFLIAMGNRPQGYVQSFGLVDTYNHAHHNRNV